MTTPAISPLQDRLPAVRGRLSIGYDLAKVTWFQVGGPAEVLFKPADADDLAQFLAGCPTDVPVTVIGVGSNLLVRDGGIAGVVVRMGRGFTDIIVNPDHTVSVGAAALDLNVAQVAADAALGGLEFLSGIPGTIGGALRMNAGAYGRELCDVLVSATVVDRQGQVHQLTPDQMDLSYRHCGLPDDWIFTGAVLRAAPGDASAINARMADIKAAREDSQPVRARTGGSTFANPDGCRAWEVIDAAGCRGLTIGGAQVSEKHCNFLLNTGSATAADLETLGEEVRRRVLAHSGITLRWEIRRIGTPLTSPSSSKEQTP
ncbi:UDP-N-acetylmuramate dehydrogenase [Insolitispirillum peregrinum]|uniref:UDP-N-acetylenolpyruvoylglucosamine reductase n=1 Tax=Insolitispirillum peregrinum TaxID=80876 RepID=A0A1N7LP30_9PROT|nr:UDP-N-acetylmuramate dehydrogenase [Insolitispirillum peregrinum]SIS75596.1 UDP-N-acetylmuramate dehydrogenase [Insolitispirillum peregrinum]